MMNSSDVGKNITESWYRYWLLLLPGFGFLLWGMFGERAPTSSFSSTVTFALVLLLLSGLEYVEIKHLRRFRDLYEKFERIEQAKQDPSERAPASA